ncbi:hypothetical protein F4782DRAFT_509490 [Xylaria castorea]|nr:hypothetical protein F4782DRAFT_509490 [Xylaria castorea]
MSAMSQLFPNLSLWSVVYPCTSSSRILMKMILTEVLNMRGSNYSQMIRLSHIHPCYFRYLRYQQSVRSFICLAQTSEICNLIAEQERTYVHTY